MKSMLSDLDFSNVKFEPGDKTKLLTGGRNAAVELIRRHNDNLVRALVAALAVIDVIATDERLNAAPFVVKELETALEPFKVANAAETELHDEIQNNNRS